MPEKTNHIIRADRSVRVIGGSIVAAVVIAIVSAAAVWGVRGIVRGQIVQILRSRLRVEAEIDNVSIGISTVTVTGLRTRSHEGQPLSFSLSRVVVELRPTALLSGGSGLVKAITADGLDGHLFLDDALAVASSGRSSGSSRAQGSAGGLERIVVRAGHLLVSDATGPLLELRGDVELDSEVGGSVALQRVVVGSEPGGRAAIDEVGAVIAVRDSKYKIDKVYIGKLQVELAQPVVSPGAGIAPGVEEGVGAEGASGQGGGSPPFSARHAGEEERGGVAGTTAGTVYRRILAMVSLLRRAKWKGIESAPAGGTTRGGFPILSLLGEHLVLVVEEATVSERSGQERYPLMDKLQGRMTGEGGGEFHLRGKGRARQGGKLGWDFRLWPEQLRAEGSVEALSLPLALVVPFLPEIPWYRPEQARVNAELVLGAESVNSLAVRGMVELSDVAISSARVAPQPIRDIRFSVNGQGHWLPRKRRLAVEEATFSMGKARASLEGAVELTPGHYLFDVDLTLPPTPCSEAVASIPEDLLDELRRFEWTGSLGGNLRLKVDSRDLKGSELNIEVADGCEFKRVPAQADLRRFRMPFMHYVLEPSGEVLEMEMGPGTASWTHLEEVSPFLVYAVLGHEDAAFFKHRGFSPAHVRRALIRNLEERRYVVGASTITMQLVKNLFLRREKTLARKVQEVLLTWWVERVMEKRDILELYLNVIEYGPRVYGIRQAARHYFNRLPSELSPAESVYLSMILPNPKRYHVHFENGSVPASWAERMRRMMLRMQEKGWYTPEAVAYGLGEIERFRFIRQGEIPQRREIPGGTRKLPFMKDYSDDWDWEGGTVFEDQDANGGEGEAGPGDAALELYEDTAPWTEGQAVPERYGPATREDPTGR